MNLKIIEDAPILCPECGHDINDANRDPDFQDQCRVFPCVCTLTPWDIAWADRLAREDQDHE